MVFTLTSNISKPSALEFALSWFLDASSQTAPRLKLLRPAAWGRAQPVLGELALHVLADLPGLIALVERATASGDRRHHARVGNFVPQSDVALRSHLVHRYQLREFRFQVAAQGIRIGERRPGTFCGPFLVQDLGHDPGAGVVRIAAHGFLPESSRRLVDADQGCPQQSGVGIALATPVVNARLGAEHVAVAGNERLVGARKVGDLYFREDVFILGTFPRTRHGNLLGPLLSRGIRGLCLEAFEYAGAGAAWANHEGHAHL